MIINDHKSSQIEVYGEVTSKKATINADKIAKLQYMLTEGLYQDALSAVIVEIVNNGMDAVIESGKDPLKHPVIVEIGRNARGGFMLTIKDDGVGMSRDFFENTFMSMLSSTKEDDATQIGHFGIGGKSWASLHKHVKFTIVKDEKKCIYDCYKGEEFIDFDLILEQDTKDGNGVKFEMELSYGEYYAAREKAKQKLAYYDTVALFLDGQLWENKIFRNEKFQWSSNKPYPLLHLCLKDVVYTIDYLKLGIPQIDIPIALRFGLEDGIIPTPSRENILMNGDTIAKIKTRIGEVATWMVEEYNKSVVKADNILDVWEFLNNTNYTLSLEKTSFGINTLVTHSKVAVASPSIKGMSLKNSGWYKTYRHILQENWRQVATLQYGIWKVKHLYAETIVEVMNKRAVLLSDFAVGHVKEYLKLKYDGKIVRFYIKAKEQTVDWYKTNVWNKKESFKASVLEIREVWRQMEERMIDERNVATSKEYLQWLKDKQDKQKEDRKNGVYKGKTLGKKEGDVTIAFARKHARNFSGHGAIFEKKAYKVSEVRKLPFLIVYTEKLSPEFQAFANGCVGIKNIGVAIVGKLEIKKLEKSSKILKFEEFMKGKGGKLFGRMCSAFLFEDALTVYKSVTSGANELVKDCLSEYQKCADELKEYVEKNKLWVDGQVREAMIDVAHTHNLFDMRLWDKYKMLLEGNKRFDFLHLFGYNRYDGNSKESYNRVIFQMLLFRKKYYGDFENYDFNVSRKPALVLEENKIIEEVIEKIEEDTSEEVGELELIEENAF